MIFESIRISINDKGTLRPGGRDILAYVFNHPLIEASDTELKTFIMGKEFKLDKDKYEGALFFCLKNNSLYINIMN
ncbi:MAG: hypothetical protein KAH32_09250, partial [Chlamydiia bacterium]|nr:hypothetical protein [Chlamydiia bacterium]